MTLNCHDTYNIFCPISNVKSIPNFPRKKLSTVLTVKDVRVHHIVHIHMKYRINDSKSPVAAEQYLIQIEMSLIQKNKMYIFNFWHAHYKENDAIHGTAHMLFGV